MSLGHFEGGEIVRKYHGLRYDVVWVRLVENGPQELPELQEWDDPDYLQVCLDCVEIKAAVDRQMEGFLDVSHFAFVHKESFGEPDNPVVPDYKVSKTARGLLAD